MTGDRIRYNGTAFPHLVGKVGTVEGKDQRTGFLLVRFVPDSGVYRINPACAKVHDPHAAYEADVAVRLYTDGKSKLGKKGGSDAG